MLGKTDEPIGKGECGTVSIWAGPQTAEVDTGEDVVALNKFADVGAGKWVWVEGGGEWELTACEC